MASIPDDKIEKAHNISTELKEVVDKPKQFTKVNKQTFLDAYLQVPEKATRDITVMINFPLCNFICGYCSFPVEKYTPRTYVKTIEKILSEIHQLSEVLSRHRVIALHFSGGTPSLLSGDDIEAIIGSLEMHTKIKGPITIEMNPEDVTDKKLTEYSEIGVDNIKIGVQTINNYLLEYLRRFTHLKNTIDMSLEIGKEYYPELVVELLYNFPNSSVEKIAADIAYFLDYKIKQFSFYPLLVFPDTSLQRFIEKGKIQPVPSLMEEYKTYLTLDNILHGKEFEELRLLYYVAQELKEIVYVPSFFEALFTPTLGLGPSAITSLSNAMVINTPDLKRYLETPLDALAYEGTVADQVWKDLFNAMLFAEEYRINLPVYKDNFSRGVLANLLKILESKDIILQNNQKQATFTAFGTNVFYFLYRFYVESTIKFLSKLKRNWNSMQEAFF
ncbi:MAG: radical SAM protein [Candidatus Odinarchaeota archaeon]|nr:radical SAM protein [Candidatus Odinarchaeota archaeon]